MNTNGCQRSPIDNKILAGIVLGRATRWQPFRYFESIVVIISLIGACLNAFGSVWGFVVWLPCNLGLAYMHHKRRSPWQSALFAAYALTAAWGIAHGVR